MESPAANVASSAPIVQPGYANPRQPAPVPVIVMASPYYAQGPAMPYAAPQAQNNKSKMWILGIIAVCLVLFVILGIIGIVMFTNRNSTCRNCKTQTVVEGIMFGNQLGVFLVSLPSLKRAKISSEPVDFVAFDWNSRKVYWINRGTATKRANLDGTGVEELGASAVGVTKLAVDWITKNLYYINSSPNILTQDIRVCSNSGEKCSIRALNQLGADGIALYPSKRYMFWSNLTSTVRATMDGTDARVILSRKVSEISVDEDSERLYWVDAGHKQILSCDLNGNDERVHLNDDTGGLYGLAVHGDIIYFGSNTTQSVQSVNKDGGNLATIATKTGDNTHIALYGSKRYLPENPCEDASCDQLCILDSDSYTCICPDGVSC